MEATATATRRDGGPGLSSSRRRTSKRHEQNGSAAGGSSYTRSSRSGTIVSSTAYTSRPSLSNSTDLELKTHGYDDDDDEHLSWGERIKEQEKMKRVTELVNGGVERWFTELGVTLVFDLADAASSGKLDLTDPSWGWIVFYASSWIDALAKIIKTIRFTSMQPLPDDPCSHTGDDVPNQFFLRRVTTKILQVVKSKLFLTNNLVTGHASITADDQIQFARFTQVVMSKMLVFVDVLLALDISREFSVHGKPDIYCYHKSLKLLLDVHGALSKALHVIDVLHISSPPGEVQTIRGKIFGLLSRKEDKALEATWLALNDTTTHVLKRIEDWSAAQTLQEGSSDIHKVTLSVIRHISFLMDNKLLLDLIISEVDERDMYESRIRNQTHPDISTVFSMIIGMASRLQKKLANHSELFPDRGLGFLFLLNNSHGLHQCLRQPGWSSLQLYVESLFAEVNGYMKSYLQVSWDPVLSCLFNPTRFLGKNYSPLTRFESEFQKTYNTQKQWKVPDFVVRKNLRTAIIEQIIPGYTKYIEENNITTPRLAPQELEEMLQDIFEG